MLRPAAERTPNAVGSTLTELRTAMEEAAGDANDSRLQVLPGRDLVTPADLADGLHPNDRGHEKIAAAVAEVLRPRI
ncbi:hypothetical protein ACGFRG_34555 [Streptomyces sp. NPDC048696]|uniref:hypothetical protein n=1 Tax=Streptomyces sp. NPDC048696 TaxID=3365585 RepID=UPI00371FC605